VSTMKDDGWGLNGRGWHEKKEKPKKKEKSTNTAWGTWAGATHVSAETGLFGCWGCCVRRWCSGNELAEAHLKGKFFGKRQKRKGVKEAKQPPTKKKKKAGPVSLLTKTGPPL